MVEAIVRSIGVHSDGRMQVNFMIVETVTSGGKFGPILTRFYKSTDVLPFEEGDTINL